MTTTPNQCARTVLEVTPMVTRVIRTQMRQNRSPALTVPQFRALVCVRDNEGVSLSQVAEYVGLTLPSMSSLVNGLVKRGYLTRDIHPVDRRRMTLILTTTGRQMLRAAGDCTRAYLAEQLAQVSDADRTTVQNAMVILKQVFGNAGSI